MQPLRSVEMDFDLHHPCGDCPFTRNGPATHFGVITSLQQYIDLASDGFLMHTCHKTDNRNGCDGPRNFKGDKPKHCAGLLHMQANNALPMNRGLAKRGFDWSAILEVSEGSPAFKSVAEMVEHYTPAIWAWLLMVFDNPRVYTFETMFGDDPKGVRYLDAGEGAEFVPCCICGQPASHLDPQHPYNTGYEKCSICHWGNETIEQLIDLVID